MIVVKEKKPVPRAEVKCSNCGSLLEYGNADLLEDYHSANYFALYSAGHNYYFNCPVCGCKVNANWIMKMPQRIISAEVKEAMYDKPWSEDDEKMFNCALDMIEWYSGKNEDKTRLVSNWLKSLKDRFIWKPSDRQMKALNAINVTGEISYAGQGQELINLYNDLKKLKGE